MSKLAIVAFAWGLQKYKEPSVCSIKLAEEAARIKTRYENCFEFEVGIFCQKEISTALRYLGLDEKYIIKEICRDAKGQNG